MVVRFFCFLFFVSSIIVKVVVFCVIFVIEVIGKIKELFVLVIFVSKVVLIVGKF